MQPMRFQDLTLEDQFLLDEAERAMANAYAPYTHVHYGAAIRTMNKRTYLGANLENQSPAISLCAERAALAHLNTSGDRVMEAIAVIGAGVDVPLVEPAVPCGLCRQALHELAELIDRDVLLICSDTAKAKIVVGTIRELLPRSPVPSVPPEVFDRYRPILPKPSF